MVVKGILIVNLNHGNIPANEKCPNCNEDMIVKLYSASKVTSCPKCNFSIKEKIEKEKK